MTKRSQFADGCFDQMACQLNFSLMLGRLSVPRARQGIVGAGCGSGNSDLGPEVAFGPMHRAQTRSGELDAKGWLRIG